MSEALDPKDEFAAATARTDQAQEEVRHLAPILGSHFHALLLQGFERCEALELTRDLQGAMVDGDDEEND